MPFRDSQEVENRLRSNSAKLSPEEVRDLMPWMHQLSIPGERRLTAELALQNLEAVQTFEGSSRRLTKWLIGLTAVLVVLTIVIAYYSIVLARKESSVVPEPQLHTLDE